MLFVGSNSHLTLIPTLVVIVWRTSLPGHERCTGLSKVGPRHPWSAHTTKKVSRACASRGGFELSPSSGSRPRTVYLAVDAPSLLHSFAVSRSFALSLFRSFAFSHLHPLAPSLIHHFNPPRVIAKSKHESLTNLVTVWME